MSTPLRAASIRPRTEAKLLDAAEELFFSRGIAATPIDAVLALAGVSAATLYRGYSSKEALVAAALARRQMAWLETWDAEIARADSDRERLLAVLPALERFRERPHGARWCAFLASSAEYLDPPAELADAVRADTESLRGRLTELAAPLVGEEAPQLAEELLLVVTGELAMRLRGGPLGETSTAGRVADAVVSAHLQDQGLRAER
ncbi:MULTISPECIES: TetR/AcrR family transcriptional regulator [unclassified Rathayibacter]|uniref:TetR/AcrR family transcriptional regulator n=1 Tax=unclassified Rathayibacter TaxID=2609250 RepID=UPI001048947B|nr:MULTISPECIES: TetR/AcrR family transcriptional regulator [unclassified Rathayibacter]MCJ1703753.1 TetR/AcrR family transcriptional regulator [Rathayibacter sp. VKM Ac-2926]TCL82733.1 TetR family transcriptional regulator [Rathayibacter sp. PhB192]TCM28072.1 TetR family transcriptional regulator [Rathayibacter sp. PhB179]